MSRSFVANGFQHHAKQVSFVGRIEYRFEPISDCQILVRFHDSSPYAQVAEGSLAAYSIKPCDMRGIAWAKLRAVAIDDGIVNTAVLDVLTLGPYFHDYIINDI